MNHPEEQNEKRPAREEQPRTIRDCFEPTPYEQDNDPAEYQDFSGTEENALQSYFRKLNQLEPLTSEQEAALWGEMDESISQLRERIYLFGFVYEEHIKLITDAEIEDLGDIFPTGAAGSDDFLLNMPKRMEWGEKIAGCCAEIRQAFESGVPEEKLNELRRKGIRCLCERPALQGKLLEWHDVAKDFLRLLDSGRISAEELSSRTLCRPEEFRKIIKETSKIYNGMEVLRNKLIETNLRLVISIAKHFINHGLPMDDLIQEGNIGLMKALEKFNYKLGHRFCTYASWWITQGISRSLSAQSRVIRLPIHMISTIRKMNIAERNFIQTHGTEPDDSDIAKILEMPVERIRAIRKMSVQCLSLQASQSDDEKTVFQDSTAGAAFGTVLTSQSDDEKTVFQDLLANQDSQDPVKAYAWKNMRKRLQAALNKLSERERLVITMRYGLDGGPCQTLTDVSEAFKVTRERVRQIELKTLAKLRENSGGGSYLDDFYL